MTRLPSPPRRHPIPHNAKRLRPKTYSVAVYLVGLIVVGQVVALVSIFWLRAMVVPVGSQVPKAVAGSPPAPLPVFAPVVHPPPKPTTIEMPSLPSLASSTLSTSRLSVPTVSDKLTQIGNLNDEAGIFLHHNDLDTALMTLIKAEDLDPRNPTTLENLAETYYLMNNPARSKIYRQRLVDLGPGVGTVYGVAKDDVHLLNQSHDADTLKEQSPFPRLLYIDDVEKTPVEMLNGQPQFRLRTVLMRKDPKMVGFNQKKLQPYVIFYQQMPDGTLVPDLGQRKGAFDDTFLFWSNQDREPFGVDYIMPTPGTRGPGDTVAGEYYGFIIGIYYDKVLQDVRSEPSDLVTRMPLPEAIE